MTRPGRYFFVTECSIDSAGRPIYGPRRLNRVGPSFPAKTQSLKARDFHKGSGELTGFGRLNRGFGPSIVP